MKRRRSFKKGDKVWYKGELAEITDIWTTKGLKNGYCQYKVEWGSKTLHTRLENKELRPGWFTVSSVWVFAKDLKRATRAEIVAETLKG